MTLREIMKYIESEFSIINKTPCDICGGSYLTKDLSINLLD
ncbi:TPA: metal-binding protein, partial [Clostridium botulinum]